MSSKHDFHGRSKGRNKTGWSFSFMTHLLNPDNIIKMSKRTYTTTPALKTSTRFQRVKENNLKMGQELSLLHVTCFPNISKYIVSIGVMVASCSILKVHQQKTTRKAEGKRCLPHIRQAYSTCPSLFNLTYSIHVLSIYHTGY